MILELQDNLAVFMAVELGLPIAENWQLIKHATHFFPI